MGRLEAHLDGLAAETENSFAQLFEDFSNEGAQQLFADLFKEDGKDL